MGIFDFLFGKKKTKEAKTKPQTNKSIPQKPEEQKPPRKEYLSGILPSKYDKEWIAELDHMITMELKTPNPLYQFKSENAISKSVRDKVLQAYNVGSGKEKPNTDLVNHYSQCNYQNATNYLFILANKHNNRESEKVKVALKGCVIGGIVEITEINNHSKNYAIQSFLNVLLRNKETYLTSLALEELDSKKIKGKLAGLIHVYTAPGNVVPKEIEEEIINVAISENVPHGYSDIQLFQSKEELRQFLEFQKYCKALDRQMDIPALISAQLEEERKTTSDMSHFLKLFVYYEEFGNTRKANSKQILDYLIKHVNVDYSILHELMSIYSKRSYYNGQFTANTLMKLVKKYFTNEPLDSKSYEALKKCMWASDTIARTRSINDFLLSKTESLYNMHDPELHQLIHSGILHNASVEQSYYGAKSESTKHLYGVITLLSQIVSAKVEKEDPQSGVNTINIGGQSIDIAPKDLQKINTILFDLGIPYQLADYYHDGRSWNNDNLVSTLLVNEDQYSLISQSIDSKKLSTRGKRWYKNIKFATVSGGVEPLSNNIKQLSKKAKSEISANRFIHDIKWKDVKNKIVDQFPNRRAWYDMMHLLLSYSGTVEPSKTWLDKVQEEKNKMSEEEFRTGLGELQSDMLSNEFWYNKENLKAMRGVIWASTFLSVEEACPALEKILENSYTKVIGVGPKSVSAGSSAMAALIHIDAEESYNVLVRLKERTKYDRFEKQLKEALTTFEFTSKSTVISLKESAMDDYGFVDGSKIVLIDTDVFVQWKFKNRKVKSQWIDGSGKKLPKAPIVASQVSIGNRAQTKIINDAIIEFDNRMDSYRFSDIKWSSEEWKNNYLKHAFVAHIIDNYLWIIQQEDGTIIPVITKDQKTFDINDQWYILGETDTVRPYHMSIVGEKVNKNWIQYFVKNKISPEIDFFYRTNFNLQEGIDAIQLISNHSPGIYTNGKWQYHNDKSSEFNVLELPFIDKMVMFERPNKKTLDETPKVKITYHDLVQRNRNRSFNFSKIGPPIDDTTVPEKVKLECLKDLMDRLVMRNMNQNTGNITLKEYLTIPPIQMLDHICNQIQDKKLFENFTYENLTCTIKGALNAYEIPILEQRVVIPAREKNNVYRFYNVGTPKKDILKQIGIPTVKDGLTSNLLSAIEQLTNDQKITNKLLSNWVGVK